ncbi:MAG TPA: hypothetical protein VI233_00395 [Puia sp.]
MKKLSLILTIALLICACKKHAADNSEIHLLGFQSDRSIKINQIAIVYDSTILKDSMSRFNPPTTRLYMWKISPDNGAATLGSAYNYGLATLSFSRSGSYQVMADIYDSLTRKLVAHTNTVTVQVGKDTLFPYYRVFPDDVLTIRPGPYNISNGQDFNFTGMQLIYSTTRSYVYSEPYLQPVYAVYRNNNSYSFIFSDSLRLMTYPFVWGYDSGSTVNGVLSLPGFTNGMTIDLNIVWLGKPYTGTIKLTSKDYSINWDNSGAVKFSN